MGGSRAQETARKKPGQLLKQGLAAMSQYLPQGGPSGSGELWTPRVTQYLVQVVLKQSRDLGVRNERELRTLAQSLDAMLTGNYLLAADTLMARFAAVELAAAESNNWAVPKHLELIPTASAGVASEKAKADAVREESTALRLRRAMGGAPGGGHQRKRPWGDAAE